MFNYRTILILLFGVFLIMTRKEIAKNLFKHYSPILGSAPGLLPVYSTLVIIFSLLITAFGLFFGSYSTHNPDFILGSSVVWGGILLSGIVYLIWAIPGYYRWKKNKKGIELALFVAKLSIGILILIGVASHAIYQ